MSRIDHTCQGNANNLKVLDGMEFGGQATVYAQELLVHYSSEWKCTKGFHACVI